MIFSDITGSNPSSPYDLGVFSISKSLQKLHYSFKLFKSESKPSSSDFLSYLNSYISSFAAFKTWEVLGNLLKDFLPFICDVVAVSKV